MADHKAKHLEFIQEAIKRMNTLSFQIKGWCITLVSAINVLAAKDVDHDHILLVYWIVPIFWAMDAFYLSQERQYRTLYNEVRLKKEADIDFNMQTQASILGKNSWISAMFSVSNWPVYLILLGVTVYIMFNC
ncbi:MAG TPA: hypothetical protein PLL28_11145 [Chitinophagales bacterium]|nr:hypothetical protein [Saprospiraceae bacterium]HNF69924.1 hypothetical protein [Chitinophagales bacterium]HNJ90430.1 hypothetical protein [Chitinophagales bacterium]HNO29777.1 hypothetical protein [Chitinophagales bacterium]